MKQDWLPLLLLCDPQLYNINENLKRISKVKAKKGGRNVLVWIAQLDLGLK